MKQAILIACIALLMFAGCKTRQVSITRIDSTHVSHSVQNTDSTVVKKDTSSHKVNQVVISSDSGNTVTVVTPDSGKTLTINGGQITGIGKITKTHKYVSHKVATKNVLNQNKTNDSTSFKNTVVKNDSTHIDKKVKVVVATPSYGWIIYAAIGLVILAGLIWVAWKVFKPKI